MGHRGPTIRFMCLIQCLVLNEHLYLSVIDLDVNLKSDTKKTLVKKRLNYVLNLNVIINIMGEGGLI